MQVVLIRLVPVRTPCGCITASSLITALRSSVLGVCMRRLFGLVQDRALIPTINGRTQVIWIGFRLVRLQSLIHGTQRCREMRTTTYVLRTYLGTYAMRCKSKRTWSYHQGSFCGPIVLVACWKEACRMMISLAGGQSKFHSAGNPGCVHNMRKDIGFRRSITGRYGGVGQH